MNRDLNEVLNLNSALLTRNRQQALNGAQAALSRRKLRQGNWSRESLARVLELRSENPLQPYFGIVESRLERRVAR